ncbi:MAG: cysteine--tRNA ligase [Candidatus Dadabacteria bacterium]|nr:cysteine--tRNA ligase [Candidatus Dadabacteria bacterium]NIS08212.1 cysteine--tRNA ligase [Candidatus Dadabacteria bacterium]NIV41479.1 cysteine--tRNA ligase [Candidatus Dadabacteria bacterium]NIX15122.1 cysteine--tRNA ligase [Candidatus Dadabacteria bacterium]NIY21700.1 cysteine--tRNA ligase [Candidatus Dadabacteria bacterium]
MLKKVKTYNTLSGKKETLVPKDDNIIRMYVCGPTVYDSAHLGHARAALTFDIIRRFLKHLQYDVNYVRNVTDIDDKIIERANSLGIEATEVSERYTKEYQEDMAALGILPPDHEPKVSDHIHDIINLIETLINKDVAYVSGNDVFFSIDKFIGYGKLSRRTPDDMIAGSRIDINEKKENPLDFALWKGAKEGEPFWESPWGNGRPGWHIECSTMSMKYLGQDFEIHGGGKDLIFPHHENEIAQSEAATDEQFAKYWIHNGLIQIDKEKMSKSIGNIINVREALKRWNKEAIRLFFLSHHYRNPADFSQQNLDDAEASLQRLYLTLQRIKNIKTIKVNEDEELKKHVEKFRDSWESAMQDDFNTAGALGNLFDFCRVINKSIDSEGGSPTLDDAVAEIRLLGNTFGILEQDPDEYLQKEKLSKSETDISEQEINDLIEQRNSARAEKNWQRSDEIRDYLNSKGIVIEDSSEGTVWRVKS